MIKKKISVVFGTRPEAIKLAPVILALKSDPRFSCHVCVTAQHRQMLDQVLSVFNIVPNVDLDLMKPNQTLGSLTSLAIASLDSYFAKERPDLVLVQGDTTTVFCAALAAFYHHIPVGHVEAGLRTNNLHSPWPEEANRVLTSRLADLYFAPTTLSQDNLLCEGVSRGRIFVTGNTVIDALCIARDKIKTNHFQIPGIDAYIMTDHNLPVVLITGHRRESFGTGFELICQAIRKLADRFTETHFIYPVHLNPHVREPVNRLLGNNEGNIHLIEPLSYLPFVAMMDRSKLILTDSGGIQEEAPSLGKPVLVMRDTTERPEAIAAGTARLVGTDCATIVNAVTTLLTDPEEYGRMSQASNPYGDGKACERILAACGRFLGVF